jgi:uncharacterized metal-binding protein YceD (DUF177 family)
LIPPPGYEIALEVGHRFIATLLGMLIVLMVILAFSRPHYREYRNLSLVCLVMVLIQGILGGTLSIACDRCGQPLKLIVDEEFTFKMVPEANLDSQNGKEVFLEDEDLDMDFYRDDQIDWKGILEDQVILALPIRNLCEEQGQLACEIPLNPQEIENLKTDNPFSSLSNSGWENN